MATRVGGKAVRYEGRAYHVSDPAKPSFRDLLGLEEGVWPPRAWDPIFSEIGRIVFQWNNIERTTTQILNILIGGVRHRAMIVTAHMGSITQLDALRTLAEEYLEGAEHSHVVHLIKLFESLRERRNYYVHSFSLIANANIAPLQPSAVMHSLSARGRLKRHENRITADVLRKEAMNLHAAQQYFALVHNHLHYPDKPEYKTLPEKFPILSKLTKPSLFVLADRRPPRSSRA